MPSKSKIKNKKKLKNYFYQKDEKNTNPEIDNKSKKNENSKKKYMKRKWNEYLKDNHYKLEINLKKRKELTPADSLHSIVLDENNRIMKFKIMILYYQIQIKISIKVRKFQTKKKLSI